MSMDMRALYYVTLPSMEERDSYGDSLKANENSLNQNFLLIVQKLEELEERVRALE